MDSEDPTLLAEFIAQLSSTADSARQEDTGSIRYAALAYIPFYHERDALEPPITKQSTKSARGFNHPTIARLLCPVKRVDELHGLTEVTGRTMAYAAVQARFMLCTFDQWKRYDGNFDHEAFYNNIVQLFERRPDHPWVRETHGWWNRERPGLTQRTKKRKRPAEHPDQSSSDEEAVNEILGQWGVKPDEEDQDDTPDGYHQQEEEDHDERPPRAQQRSNRTNHEQHLHHESDEHRPENDGRTTHHNRNENMAPRRDGGQEQGDRQQVRSPHQRHDTRLQGNNDSIAHAEAPRYQRHRNCVSSRSATPTKRGKQTSRAEREGDEEEDESPPPS